MVKIKSRLFSQAEIEGIGSGLTAEQTAICLNHEQWKRNDSGSMGKVLMSLGACRNRKDMGGALVGGKLTEKTLCCGESFALAWYLRTL